MRRQAFFACSISVFFTDTSPTVLYTLSLHDALPICLVDPTVRAARRRGAVGAARRLAPVGGSVAGAGSGAARGGHGRDRRADRKSTRLNSSHRTISYAVFCLKKKKKTIHF